MNSFSIDYEDNESVTITLYCDGIAIGTLNYIIRKWAIYINEMDIHELHQKQGNGRKLFQYFMKHISDLYIHFIELTAAEDAYQFWEKMGFTHIQFNHQLVYRYVMRLNIN